jgi:hypothetical protein
MLAFNTIATEHLNKKYNSVVEWNSDEWRYCEYNGNEYITSGKATFTKFDIGTAVEIFDVYYDEEHPKIILSLEVTENKFGKITYQFDIEEDAGYETQGGNPNFGGLVYVDKNFNQITTDNQSIDMNMITYMDNLHEEIERLIEIANDKWDLGLSYKYNTIGEL